MQWQPSSFFFLLLLSARNVNEMTSLFCDVVALFRKLLCHARQWSRQLKGAYWIWSLFFLFFHGEGWRIWGAVSDSPDVFVKCCEFVLSSRVNLVSCSNSSPLSFFHWFSFFFFSFCLSPVKFDIILFLKVEFILVIFFFLFCGMGESQQKPIQVLKGKKIKFGCESWLFSCFSAQGKKGEILIRLCFHYIFFMWLFS